MPQPVGRTCLRCGKPLDRNARDSSGPRVACSRACAKEAWRGSMLHGPNGRTAGTQTESVNVKVAAGVLARLRAVKAAIMLDPAMASDDGSLLATAALLKLSEVERRLTGPVEARAFDDEPGPEAEAHAQAGAWGYSRTKDALSLV